MAQRKAIILSLLLSISLLSFQCKKHCDPVTPEIVMIPQEILDYVDFNIGSYWITKDSVSGRIDSVVVIGRKHIMEDQKQINECGDLLLTKQFENV
jgi:hypothetical protein